MTCFYLTAELEAALAALGSGVGDRLSKPEGVAEALAVGVGVRVGVGLGDTTTMGAGAGSG